MAWTAADQAAAQAAGEAAARAAALAAGYSSPSQMSAALGGGGGQVYGSKLATGIAQSFGANPSSLSRDQYGGVSAANMGAAIQNRSGGGASQPTSYSKGPPAPSAPGVAGTLGQEMGSMLGGVNYNPTPQYGTNNFDAQLATMQNIYNQQISALQRQLAAATNYNPVIPTPAPTPPPAQPNPITTAPPTTNVPTAPQENPNLNIPEGPAGFVFPGVGQGVGLPTAAAPSPDATYNLWKRLSGGQDNPQMQAYFQSPDWQSVVAGNIPLWMAADPVFRTLLLRLGYMKPSFDQDMQNAIQNAINQQQQQSSASAGTSTS